MIQIPNSKSQVPRSLLHALLGILVLKFGIWDFKNATIYPDFSVTILIWSVIISFNKISSKVYHEFCEVSLAVQPEFFADAVAADFNSTGTDIHKCCNFLTRNIHPKVCT